MPEAAPHIRAVESPRVMRVAIVGGTGAFGRALAARLRDQGLDVSIGSRDPVRAQELGSTIGVASGTNEAVVRTADYVVLAVQSSAAVGMASDLAGAIGRKPLLCVASDLHFGPEGVTPGRKEGSIAEDVANVIQGPVASGFQAVPAAHLARAEPLDEDVLVCGEPAAKEPALEFGAKLVTGRAIDAGPLENSRALESMTAVILHVNRQYKVVAGLRLTGFK
jgi:8-hydroxy-5-deazaflavin:NADPH oxidoreductase